MSDFESIAHIKQPNGYTCAAAVLAMVSGCALTEAIRVLRPTPRCGTPNTRLIRALKDLGVRCGDRFVSLRGRPLPDTAVIRLRYENKRTGHVVVKRGRTWFDPLLDAPFTGEPIMTVSGARVWFGCSRIASSLWFGGGL